MGSPLLVFVNAVIYAEWGRADLDESLGFVSCPTGLCFAVLTELRFCQVVVAVDTYRFKSVRTQFQDGGTSDVTLARGQHGLDIRHYGLQILALVHLLLAEGVQPQQVREGEGGTPPLAGALLKNEQDLELLQHMAARAAAAYR